MKIGIFTNLFQDKPLNEVAQYVSSLGYQMVELPAWEGNTHLDIEKVLKGDRSVKKILKKYNLDISALNCGIPGQLVLGPHDESTDDFAPLPDAKEKIKYAIVMMKKAAQAASELEVPIICGFVGSHVWDKWYIFPPKNEELYEKGWEEITSIHFTKMTWYIASRRWHKKESNSEPKH
jgi:sugar phosphate isomerase/epimerase